jgi:hypothetical protein
MLGDVLEVIDTAGHDPTVLATADLEVDHPVLSAYADVVGRIRERRRAVERAMAYAAE